MKRLMVVLMAIALCACLLVGCNGEPEAGENVSKPSSFITQSPPNSAKSTAQKITYNITHTPPSSLRHSVDKRAKYLSQNLYN